MRGVSSLDLSNVASLQNLRAYAGYKLANPAAMNRSHGVSGTFRRHCIGDPRTRAEVATRQTPGWRNAKRAGYLVTAMAIGAILIAIGIFLEIQT